MAATFGVTTDPQGGSSYGVFNSVNKNQSVETAEWSDEVGKVKEIKGYSQANEISGEFVKTGPPVTAGAKVTVGTVDYLCTGSNVKETNNDFQRGDVTLQSKDGCVITAYVAPTT